MNKLEAFAVFASIKMESNASVQICSHSTKLSDQRKKSMEMARKQVKERKLTIYRAAQLYKVPASTLWKWCQCDEDETPTVGRPCYLGSLLENKLKKWIFEASKTGM